MGQTQTQDEIVNEFFKRVNSGSKRLDRNGKPYSGAPIIAVPYAEEEKRVKERLRQRHGGCCGGPL